MALVTLASAVASPSSCISTSRSSPACPSRSAIPRSRATRRWPAAAAPREPAATTREQLWGVRRRHRQLHQRHGNSERTVLRQHRQRRRVAIRRRRWNCRRFDRHVDRQRDYRRKLGPCRQQGTTRTVAASDLGQYETALQMANTLVANNTAGQGPISPATRLPGRWRFDQQSGRLQHHQWQRQHHGPRQSGARHLAGQQWRQHPDAGTADRQRRDRRRRRHRRPPTWA